MGQHIDWYDMSYIVNLTKNLMGERLLRTLGGIIFDEEQGRSNSGGAVLQPDIVSPLWRFLNPKIKEMSSETLGRICAYSSDHGIHDGMPCEPTPKFLNQTGLDNIANWSRNRGTLAGRELLEEVATLTVICFAQDIVLQSRHQRNWTYSIRMDSDFERAEHHMMHADNLFFHAAQRAKMGRRTSVLPLYRVCKTVLWIL